MKCGQSGFSRIVLDNGLTVLIQKKDTESASFGVGLRFGCVHQPVAHLIEHLLFKGTTTRTYKDINLQAVRWGGSLDAFTDFFSTFYVTKNLNRYAYDALDLLCDMITNSTIPLQEMEYEKRVLLEEIKMRSEEPESILMDTLYKRLYPNHLLGNAVLDNRQLICSINHSEALEIYHQFYVPERTIVIGVGNIDEKAVLAIVKKYFHKPSRPIDELAIPPLAYPSPPRRIIIPRTNCQIHLMVGLGAVPCTHADYYPLRVLSATLGENINSRLYERAREKQGLVYNITSHYNTMRSSWQSVLKTDCSQWHGILRIYTRFSPRNLTQVETIIKEELERFTPKKISEKELLISQQKLAGERKLATLGTFRHMHLLFAAEINNTIGEFDEFDNKIYAVTPARLLEVARKYTFPAKHISVILKPE